MTAAVDCGYRFAMDCPRCGAFNSMLDEVCGCGHRFAQSVAAPSDERDSVIPEPAPRRRSFEPYGQVGGTLFVAYVMLAGGPASLITLAHLFHPGCAPHYDKPWGLLLLLLAAVWVPLLGIGIALHVVLRRRRRTKSTWMLLAAIALVAIGVSVGLVGTWFLMLAGMC